MGFDELAGRLGWPVERVAGELLRLELEGRVTALPGGRLMRVHRR
jgi:predicted Rossmann fold nucleotide-binding protein DprA/Smf involved in DNA uptake